MSLESVGGIPLTFKLHCTAYEIREGRRFLGLLMPDRTGEWLFRGSNVKISTKHLVEVLAKLEELNKGV